jgi:hypothetical protein
MTLNLILMDINTVIVWFNVITGFTIVWPGQPLPVTGPQEISQFIPHMDYTFVYVSTAYCTYSTLYCTVVNVCAVASMQALIVQAADDSNSHT